MCGPLIYMQTPYIVMHSTYVTVSGKRVHSVQNVHSGYKRLYRYRVQHRRIAGKHT